MPRETRKGWQDLLRELIALDPKRVRAIMDTIKARPIHVWDGFTLIELSIALVIIGLIVGGVLAGQDLMRAARLRAEMSTLLKYEAAINAFKAKYNAVPGDMVNATNMITGVTHNGNGDGTIDLLGGPSQWQEYAFIWEHLSKAGLIEGSYDGNFTWTSCAPTTCPPSKINSADVFWAGGAHDWFGGVFYNNNGLMGGNESIAFYWTNAANWNAGSSGLTVAEAQGIDIKMDDGIAATGRLLTVAISGSNCITGSPGVLDGSAVYNLSDKIPDYTVQYFTH